MKRIDLIQHGGFAGTQYLKTIIADQANQEITKSIDLELKRSGFFERTEAREESDDVGKDNHLVYEIVAHDDKFGFKSLTVAENNANRSLKYLIQFLKAL